MIVSEEDRDDIAGRWDGYLGDYALDPRLAIRPLNCSRLANCKEGVCNLLTANRAAVPVVVEVRAGTDEAGHAFQSEAGHGFRREAGRCSDLKPAT